MADGNLNSETQEQLDLLERALNELKKQATLNAKTQADINATLKKNSDSIKDNTVATVEQTSVSKEFVKDMAGFGSEIGSAISQIRENRENFTSLNPAIRAAGQVFGAAGKAVGSMAENAGDAVQGLAGLSKGWKGFAASMVAGGAIKALGSGLKNSSEAASEMAVAFGEFATGELQNVVESYRKVGSAGAIGAGGMNEMYESATKLGIGLAGFADVVSRNGQSLAYAGGSTLAGTKALVSLTENSKDYEDKLLALGYTFSEMRDESAKFLERNQTLGIADINDKKRLAEANNSYMLQLDQLSRITGKSRDEIAKQLDQQMKDVRFQATLRTLQAQNGQDNARAVENIAVTIGKEQGEYAKKGFMDAMSGAINTPEAQNFLQTLDEGGRQAIENLRNGAIKDTVTGFKDITQSQKRWYEGKGGDTVFGRLAGTGSAMEPMIGALMKAKTLDEKYYDNMRETVNEQKGAMAANDQATKDSIKAQKELQAMGQQLDDIVRQKVLPTAAKSIKTFTGAIDDFVNVASKALGTSSSSDADTGYADTAAGAGAGAMFQGASNSKAISDAMSARTAQKKQIYGSEEFKAWRSEKGGGGLMSSGMEDKQYGVDAYMADKGIAAVPIPEAITGTSQGAVSGSVDQILKTIRTRESNGNYQSQAKGSTASGAYQFIDRTWQSLAKKYGIGTEFARAGDAPAEVQDALASKYVEEILKQAGGDVSKVPLAWYTGNIQGKMSAAGAIANNGLDPGTYQKNWMADFNSISGNKAALGGVFSGPRSGYSATLHGNEAVVPLPNGNQIPVEMSGMTDSLDEQLALLEEQTSGLEELLRTLRQGADISQRLLRVSQA